MQHLVFVYGTLRHGESNHHHMVRSELLGTHETPPEYALYDLGPYPAVVAGHQTIRGEVYLIDNDTLVDLDKLENVPVEYRREQILTPFGLAWIYLYQEASNLELLIDSGDWCQKM